MSHSLVRKIDKIEFEGRIFFSLGIVLLTLLLSLVVFSHVPSSAALLGKTWGWPLRASSSLGYGIASLFAILASLLRIWAGSILTSQRMMSFRVRDDVLIVRGPYRIVRNPIYLADLVAFTGFVFCLPPIGVAMPVFLFLHYTRLIAYEEQALLKQFGASYEHYRETTPSLLPDWAGLRRVRSALLEFEITRDGFRHNGLYLLFIPGFILASHFHSLLVAIAVGFPSVIDWYIVHTRKGLAPRQKAQTANATLTKSKLFGDILYAQCWEDPQIDRQAFGIRPGDVVFSITSGGCNALTFLLDNPQKVIALDINPCQNFLLELKASAFRTLNHGEMLELMGVRASRRREELFSRTRTHLSPAAAAFWDSRTPKVRRGILYGGRFERYMRLLRMFLVMARRKRRFLEALYALDHDPGARARLYRERWESPSWRFLTRVVLSRKVMTLLFDKAFFAQLDSDFSFGRHFARKIERALTELPLRGNPFLSFIALGRFYDEQHLPPYLKRKNYDIIRSRLDRLLLITQSCDTYFASLPDSSVDKFNFTNIFEWMTEEDFARLLRQTVRVARPGAVLTYRNLLVPRSHPASLDGLIVSDTDLSRNLHDKDLSFIYNSYVVERIQKGERP